MNEGWEFEQFTKWHEEHRLSSWKRTLLSDEKDKPMPENWSMGYYRQRLEAWMARAAVSAAASPPK